MTARKSTAKELVARVRRGMKNLAAISPDAIAAIRELVRREDAAAQVQVARIVARARDAYDPGHRAFEATPLDVLAGKLLPKFQPAALVELLRKIDYDLLVRDGFDALFPVAFRKLRGDATPLVKRLLAHVAEARRYGGDHASLAKLVAKVARDKRFGKHRAKLLAAVDGLRKDVDLATQLESEDPAVLTAAFERVGGDVPFDGAIALKVASVAAWPQAMLVSFETFEALARRAFAGPREARHPETNLGRILWPLFRLDPQRAIEVTKDLSDRAFLISCLEWTVRDGDAREALAYAAAQDALAMAKGEDLAVAREARVLEQRRRELERAVKRHLRRFEFEAARAVARDQLDILDLATFRDILLDAFIADDEMNPEQLASAASVILVMLDHKLANPDPEAGFRRGKVPAHLVADFVEKAKPAVERFPELDPHLTARVRELAGAA